MTLYDRTLARELTREIHVYRVDRPCDPCCCYSCGLILIQHVSRHII